MFGTRKLILVEEVIAIVRLGLNSGSDLCGLTLIIYIYLLFFSFNSFSHPFFYFFAYTFSLIKNHR